MASGLTGLPQRPSAVLRAGERVRVVGLFAAIAVVTGVAFGLVGLIGGQYAFGPGAGGFTFVGLAFVAYVLGLRHGVDADHIAAIDNTTRKLLQEGRRPLTVGTWFSLGHSSVVVALVVGLAFATRAIESALPILRTTGTIVGTLVSGSFLWIIGLLNVVIAVEIYRIFRGLRSGTFDVAQLEDQLSRRGFLNRYFGRLFRMIDRPVQMYPIGFLFGLGFDTATEVLFIALTVPLVLTGAIPIVVVLVFPLLFTCGMVLVDTADGIAMRYAYGWAFRNPFRKVYYNLTVTVISVLVAFAIGGVEFLQVLANELGLSGGLWRSIATLDFETLGVVVVGLFLATWGISTAYFRYKGYDKLGALPPRMPETTA